jgi:hypothetical protein
MGQAVGPSTKHLASEHAGHMPAMGVYDGNPNAVAASDEPAEVQIARALSARPKHVTDGARIVGADGPGNRVTLREGHNGFVCYAGSLKNVAEPPQCNSTNSKPAIWYMLAGATQPTSCGRRRASVICTLTERRNREKLRYDLLRAVTKHSDIEEVTPSLISRTHSTPPRGCLSTVAGHRRRAKG